MSHPLIETNEKKRQKKKKVSPFFWKTGFKPSRHINAKACGGGVTGKVGPHGRQETAGRRGDSSLRKGGAADEKLRRCTEENESSWGCTHLGHLAVVRGWCQVSFFFSFFFISAPPRTPCGRVNVRLREIDGTQRDRNVVMVEKWV